MFALIKLLVPHWLVPVVLHGAGPQLNDIIERGSVISDYIDGIRVTDALLSYAPETPAEILSLQTQRLRVARRVFLEEDLKLVQALERLGTRARPITSGVLKADYHDKDKHGPALSPSFPVEGQILNVNTDIAAGELAKELEPMKIVFLNEGGLFHGVTGQKLGIINLDEEYGQLMKEPWVKFGTKLVQEAPRPAPAHLKELFMDSSTGMLVRRGYKLLKHDTINKFGADRFRQVIHDCDPSMLAGY
ncbi:hypothetical protein BDN71DRAFT_1512830 [Pleurotus eryngii]|uniref:Uncharacterized protein n=1 Tax=Pleurotus eryngii TaxID=5323 RepID=A0A9P5ZLT3_PLEER|nr:hypothetical protein BDN71DRAFT_1512830 [Pleurotus eryngii]